MSNIANNRTMSDSVNTTSSNLDEQKHRMYRRAIILVTVVLLATTLAAGWTTQQVVTGRLERFFESQSDQIADTLYNNLNRHITVLEGLRGLWNVDGRFTQKSFETYLSSLDLNTPDKTGVSSYIYAPLVEESYPVTYIYPLAGKESALGIDFGRESERLDAITYARDTNNLATTKNLILQTTGQPGFFFILPLYTQEISTETKDVRRNVFSGVIGSAFRSESAFEQIYGTTDPYPYLDFQIYQGEATTPDRLLYDHDKSEATKPPKFETKRIVRLAGQTWTVLVQSKPSLTLGDSEERLPIYIFLGGLISTILVISLSLKNYIKHLKTHSKLN